MSSSHKSTPGICRILIQQCLTAQLSFDTNDPPVSIRHGIVVYACFLQGAGAAENSIDNIAKTILEAKLSEPPTSNSNDGSTGSTKRISPIELISNSNESFDVLLIPQATLCGKLKGKAMQYHGLIEKAQGNQLFLQLVETFRNLLGQAQAQAVNNVKEGEPESDRCIVNHGVYGARQILKMETNGPFTHVIDF